MRRHAQLIEAVVATFGNVTSTKPYRILEVGCRTIEYPRLMILEAKKRGRAEIHYFGFGQFDQPDLSATDYDSRLRKSTGISKVNLFRGNPRNELPDSVSGLPPMDVVFIGGGWEQDDFEMIVGYALQAMAPKGVMMIDDYVMDDLSVGSAATLEKFRKEMVGASIDVLPIFDEVNGRKIRMSRLSRRTLTASASPAAKLIDAPLPAPVYEVISRESLGPPEVGPDGGFPSRLHHPDLQAVSIRQAGGQERLEGPAGEGSVDRRREPGLESGTLAGVSEQPAGALPVPEERSESDSIVESRADAGERTATACGCGNKQRCDLSKRLDRSDDSRDREGASGDIRSVDEHAGSVSTPADSPLQQGNSVSP